MQALLDRVSHSSGLLARAADRVAGTVLRPAEGSACWYYGRSCCSSACHVCDRLLCGSTWYCSNCSYFCC